MLYASSSHVVFLEAGIVGKVFDLVDCEEINDRWLTSKLEASKTRP
jgi:hypothetical protein